MCRYVARPTFLSLLQELSTRLRRAEALLGELRAALLANPHLTGARLAADGASGFALEACDYAGLRLLRVGIAASVAQYPLGEQWNATVQARHRGGSAAVLLVVCCTALQQPL